jgi:predicted peptidase
MKHTTTAAFAAFLLLTAGARAADKAAELAASAFEKRVFTSPSGKVLPYRLMKPEDYDPAAPTAYPLVIFLHGLGERGTDNELQLRNGVKDLALPEARKRHPCFVVAPQCPVKQYWAKFQMRDADVFAVWSKEPTEPAALVLELADAIPKEFHIDQKRVYLTGTSMGGLGTWDLLARQPERFAAAIPVCAGGIEANAPLFARVPMWVFHGAADSLVLPRQSRRMVEAVRKAGGKPGYTEYPGVNHDAWVQTYRNPDVLDWLFAQKKE